MIMQLEPPNEAVIPHLLDWLNSLVLYQISFWYIIQFQRVEDITGGVATQFFVTALYKAPPIQFIVSPPLSFPPVSIFSTRIKHMAYALNNYHIDL